MYFCFPCLLFRCLGEFGPCGLFKGGEDKMQNSHFRSLKIHENDTSLISNTTQPALVSLRVSLRGGESGNAVLPILRFSLVWKQVSSSIQHRGRRTHHLRFVCLFGKTLKDHLSSEKVMLLYDKQAWVDRRREAARLATNFKCNSFQCLHLFLFPAPLSGDVGRGCARPFLSLFDFPNSFYQWNRKLFRDCLKRKCKAARTERKNKERETQMFRFGFLCQKNAHDFSSSASSGAQVERKSLSTLWVFFSQKWITENKKEPSQWECKSSVDQTFVDPKP